LTAFEGEMDNYTERKGKDMGSKENADNEVMYRKDNGCPLK
jgi:hypothetical protein